MSGIGVRGVGSWFVGVMCVCYVVLCVFFFFFKQKTAYEMAQESRGLGDVYKRQSKLNIQ